MLHTVCSTRTLKPIFLYMKKKKKAVFLCLLKDLNCERPLVVHCPNSGIFITEEFVMFLKKKERKKKKTKKN